ncbi:MAG: chorismate synthase, partial [Methanobacteriota archaeon]
MNTFGVAIRLSLFGESHGAGVGVTLDGLPPGLPFDLAAVQAELDRRRPGQSKVTTSRAEPDRAEVLSGTYGERTTGAPLTLWIRNEDKDSSKYDELVDKPRPGHADYPARVKYGGANDLRGGGMFSGRLTAGLVMAGAVVRPVTEAAGIRVAAHTSAIGGITAREVPFEEIVAKRESNIVRCADATAAKAMEEAIMAARKDGDSLGGIVHCEAHGAPVGLGEPWFDSIESSLSHLLFSIPAVKAVEFGSGFRLAAMRGSEANDAFEFRDG